MIPHAPSRKILIVEDDEATANLVSLFSLRNGFSPVIHETLLSAGNANLEGLSALLLDLDLPDGDGLDFLCQARNRCPNLPCFILTAHDKASAAVTALKAGATDYFTKPFEPEKVFASIREAVAAAADRPPAMSPVAGEWSTDVMKQVYAAAHAAAVTKPPVLVVGEQGTGKKTLGHFIHLRGPRADHPFVVVDASASEPEQLNLELFGGGDIIPGRRPFHKNGKSGMANGGTLLIQNVECLPAITQKKLLELLVPGGSPDSDFRLICTSTLPPAELLVSGRLRKDLFYRIAASPIHLPPLRDLGDDLNIICKRLLTDICVLHRLRWPTFTRKAREFMLDHSWPGNLDEFRSALEHAVMRNTTGLIGPEDFPAHLKAEPPKINTGGGMVGHSSINDLERASLVSALAACNGNRRRAAKRLGVSLRTIYNMIARHNLKSDETSGTDSDKASAA